MDAAGAFRLADRVLPVLAKLPVSVQQPLFQLALNRILAQPLAHDEFALLEQRWLCLRVTDLQVAWYISVQNRRLLLGPETAAQVSIAGTWRDFLLLASREEDPDTLFFRRRLVLEGDTELGLALKNKIDSLDPDNLPPWLWRLLGFAGRQLSAVHRAD